jgi:hypothetical protein
MQSSNIIIKDGIKHNASYNVIRQDEIKHIASSNIIKQDGLKHNASSNVIKQDRINALILFHSRPRVMGTIRNCEIDNIGQLYIFKVTCMQSLDKIYRVVYELCIYF